MGYDCNFCGHCFQWALTPIMLDDSTKEKLFVLLFVVIVALSFILHIPKYIEVWNETKIKSTKTNVEMDNT